MGILSQLLCSSENLVMSFNVKITCIYSVNNTIYNENLQTSWSTVFEIH